jgi:predicted negative regulator of RcsB-dependent stress response
LGEDQLDAAVANFETLKVQYPKSAYVSLAALQMAAARIEAGQAELSVSLLEHAMANAQPEPLRVIARERLARVKLDLGDIDGALKLIAEAPTKTGFESRFAELRGDALLAQGNIDDAASAYRQALDLQESGVGFRRLLEMKLESLSGDELTDTGS